MAALSGAGDVGQVADAEIVVGAGRDVMAVAQQRGHLSLRAHGMLVGIRTDQDGAVDVLLQAALDFRLKGGFGNKHHVVAVLAVHGLPLALQHADHLKGHVIDANGLADGIEARAEEFVHDGLAQDGVLGLPVHIGGGKERALGQPANREWRNSRERCR